MSTSPTDIPGVQHIPIPDRMPDAYEAHRATMPAWDLRAALSVEQAARLAVLQVLLDRALDLDPGVAEALAVHVITGERTLHPDVLNVPVQPPASDTPIGDAAAGAAGRDVVLERSKRRAS